MAALPAFDRMFLTAAWFESIFYGISCVLFGVCMYALFGRHRPLHWVNALSCIFHFSIATAHNIISLLRSLQAFTDPTIISVPNGSNIYLLRNVALMRAMGTLYLLNILALNLLLIWRLYVVWNHNWILAFVMLILEAGQIATGITSWVLVITDHTFSFVTLALGKASCAFYLALMISVTSGIAYRLWRAGRDVSDLTGHHSYKAAIYTIIESGAIYTISIVVLCGLYQSGSEAGIFAINAATQIATMTPLFLIASLTFGLMHGHDTYPEASSTIAPAFARPIQVTVTQETRSHPVDSSTRSTIGKSESVQAYHDDVS
ncbi:hypothetical protein EDD22DRAFT_898582 [Suillus occidentalis]|nr:hypothetical protein EDD22DRAFT_898582 [Suillus occidentalis]